MLGTWQVPNSLGEKNGGCEAIIMCISQDIWKDKMEKAWKMFGMLPGKHLVFINVGYSYEFAFLWTRCFLRWSSPIFIRKSVINQATSHWPTFENLTFKNASRFMLPQNIMRNSCHLGSNGMGDAKMDLLAIGGPDEVSSHQGQQIHPQCPPPCAAHTAEELWHRAPSTGRNSSPEATIQGMGFPRSSGQWNSHEEGISNLREKCKKLPMCHGVTFSF